MIPSPTSKWMMAALSFIILTAFTSFPGDSALADETTEPTPSPQVKSVELTSQKMYWDQSNRFRFYAGQGKASIKLQEIYSWNMLDVRIYDVSTKKAIEVMAIKNGETLEFDIPAEGEYELNYAYFYNDIPVIEPPVTLTLSAIDLNAPDVHTSGIKVLNLEPYQVVSEPLDVRIEPLTEPISSIDVLVDKKMIQELKPNADGIFDPIHLNSDGLEEGLHTFELLVKRPESKNTMRLLRLFSIDKEISFPDVPIGLWSRPYVEVMNQLGIVNGYPEGTFEPERAITRGEFSRVFAAVFQKYYGFKIPSAGGNIFEDVAADAWYADTVEFLHDLGFVYGEEDNGKLYFHPDRTITRAEAIGIIGRLSRFKDYYDNAYLVSFEDAADIPEWSLIEFSQLLETGWIKGFPDKKLHPLDDLSRAEAVKILSKMIGMQDVK